MWLTDIENAIRNFRKIFGDKNGFTSISFDVDNNSITFYTEDEDYCYYFDLRTRNIEKRWNN